MNIEPHNLIDPLREKFPHLIRHEKLYRMIHRQLMKKWFQYFLSSTYKCNFLGADNKQ